MGSGGVEAMLHSTFSVHEEWKYLLLPYMKVPVSRRLLHAAEKVRTMYARAHRLPGLLGDCHIPANSGPDNKWPTCHVTSFGIPDVSSLSRERARCDAVASSGAFGLLLVEPAVGAVWLHQTLMASPGMQTPWGMAESCPTDGSAACPMLTWDAKKLWNFYNKDEVKL